MQRWINTPEQLAEALDPMPPRIALDTEFVRERTYWPQLALVQVGLPDGRILLLDPLPPGMPEAIARMLDTPEVLKIMHSPSEDLVAFGHTCRQWPAPLFDTQAAAALSGLGSGLSYQKLVAEVTGHALEKGETRSDWLRRPLTDSQRHYAAEDVAHLFELHDRLSVRLHALGRNSWLEEDMLRALRNAGEEGGERWPHVGMRPAQDFDREAQARLLRLMRWRDAHARTRDLPRNWVLDPAHALALAETPPADRAALDAWLERTPKSPRKSADALWQALGTPLPDEADMPRVRHDRDLDKQRLRKLQDAVAKQAAALDLPEGLLASRKHLESLLIEGAWPQSLGGWRQAVLGECFAPLLATRG